MKAYHEYKTRLVSRSKVNSLISSECAVEIQANREYITAICDVLLLCARQNIPLRGHRESSDSINPGNFREIMALLGKYNSTLKRKVFDLPKNARYMNPAVTGNKSMA